MNNRSKIRNYCFVAGCKSGRLSCKKKIAIYHASKEMVDLWIQAVPSTDGKKFSAYDGICAKHFKEEDIIRKWRSGDVSVPYVRPRLSKQAIPCIFVNIDQVNEAKEEQYEEICLQRTKRQKVETEEQRIFEKICHSVINVPNTSWGIHILENLICINEVYLLDNVTPYLRKQITININLEVKYFYKSHQLNYNEIKNPIFSTETVENEIIKYDRENICVGGPSFNTYKPGTFLCNVAHPEQTKWRHNDCQFIVHGTDVCQKCKNLGKTLAVYKNRTLTKITCLAKLRNVRRMTEKIISR